MFKPSQKSQKTKVPRLSLPFLGLLLTCALLIGVSNATGIVNVSANASRPITSNVSTGVSRAITTGALSNTSAFTASPAQQQMGNTQLQAFQQWITLMQQYGGNVDTFQQQYHSDQLALASARTAGAYQAALTTLNGHTAGTIIASLNSA